MLTFNIFKPQEVDDINDRYSDEIIHALIICGEDYGEGNVGYCLFCGFLVIRLFDSGSYLFSILPTEEGGCFSEAVEAVREYAVKEETGLVFTDVAPELLGELISKFNYAEACTVDGSRSGYTVKIKSEADRLKEGFIVNFKDLSLSPVTKEDIPEYARLCREDSGLEFWGYDYREDGEVSDEYFFDVQEAEFARGTSISFAAKAGGRFIGEGSFYAFDYKGGAELSFRLLPEYRGRGFGEALLRALLCAAEELSLTAVYATANKRNEPSVKILSEYMEMEREDGDILHFVLKAIEI